MNSPVSPKDLMKRAFIKLFKKNKLIPQLTQVSDEAGLNRSTARHHFPTVGSLVKEMQKECPELFESLISEEDFTQEAYNNLTKVVKKHKRFLITTAVVGCKVDTKFLRSLDSYCTKNKAALLVLPSADPASVVDWNLDSILKGRSIVFADVALNNKLFVSTIKLSAKQINPTTGLSRIGQRNGSFIFASPKQQLDFVATGNCKIPHILMSTGAITLPEYTTERYMGDRTAYIAKHDHIMGAIVVEIKDDKKYQFRQVQADSNGSFIDLGTKYDGDKTSTVIPEALILGDFHSGETDPGAREASRQMSVLLKPKRTILHDLFNGISINPHEKDHKILRASRAERGQLSLEQELVGLAKDLKDLKSWSGSELVVVKSNHDDFLSRYLSEGRYVEDPHNHRISLRLALNMLDNKDPVKEGVALMDPTLTHVRWLHRDEDYKIAGVQLGAHGDKGANGSKGSMLSLEKAYQNCVVGHAHTPGILRGCYRVGTLSYLKLGYNSGPSSWLHCNCVLYSNGSRQLINIIDGEWKF